MLAKLVRFSLRRRRVVFMLALAWLVYGVYVAIHARFDVFPEFATPQVNIQSEAPGLSADQVEELVTRPIENALAGIPQLESIRSQSIQGVSAVTIVFREDADVFRVRQMVRERLAGVAGQLPDSTRPPQMGALASSTSLVLAAGLTSGARTPVELRNIADWTIRPRLLAVPGVSRVEIFGGRVRQMQVRVHPERLVAHGLTLGGVTAAAGSATGVRGAGFIDTPNQRFVIRPEAPAMSVADLGDIVVSRSGAGIVRLSDVADVVEGFEPPFGDAQVMGRDGVLVLAHAQYGANTLEVTAGIESALGELKPAIDAMEVELHPRLFRPANYIESSLVNLRTSLVAGGVLVAAVLFVFLGDLKTSIISFFSIPLSLLAAVTVLSATGASINTLTLGGLAIAVGVVVDDAIIDVDNILRRLRGATDTAGSRDGVERVILDASLEVRGAVVHASFIVALVFVPILTMSGVQGRLFAPLATAFILAVFASLLVALTVTPALCLTLLDPRSLRAAPAWVDRLVRGHRRLLVATSRHPRRLVAGTLVLVAVAVASLPFFGGEFLPEFQEGHYVLHMAAAPGTSLEESIRIGKLATASLLANPHVRQVGQQAGRAENGEDTWGTNRSEFHVDLDPSAVLGGADVAAEIRSELADIPGVTFDLLPYLAERMEETLSGATALVTVSVFGDNLDILDAEAGEIASVLRGVRGAVDVQHDPGVSAPEVVISVDPHRVRQARLLPVDVLDDVRDAYEGNVVGQVFDGSRVTSIVVLLDERSRSDPELVRELLVAGEGGIRIPLWQLANVRILPSRSLITHEAGRRRQQVTCNVTGRDVAAFVADAKSAVAARVALPAGVDLRWGGAAEVENQARVQLVVHSLLAVVGIAVLLSIAFTSSRNLVLLLVNFPFALVGGVLAVFFQGAWVSVGTLVGFVALFGITIRNSIMLISHYEHLVSLEGRTWNLQTALDGASERVVPILMTVLVTALGLLPLAVSSGQPGYEIEGPMAVVILGGLVSSTVLNLFVLPTLALRYGRFGSGRGRSAVSAGA